MKRNNKGFSLIELSIVLIIMGLLVAGVTGGASLIKSAQLRSVATECNVYRSAYNTFFAQFSRVPGSKDEDPNNSEATGGTLVWKELKDEGIIDIDANGSCINSKFKGACWFIKYQDDITTFFVRDNTLIISSNTDTANPYVGVFNENEVRNLEDKLDDGKPNTGAAKVCQKSEGAVSTLANWNATSDKEPNYGLVIKLDF